MALRDQILSARDFRIDKVAVPEWNCEVYLRTMSGTQRSEYEQAVYKDGKPETRHFFAELLCRCLCDETGNLIFSSADVAALSDKSAPVLARLAEQAAKLNRVDNEAPAEAKKD
ncbi:MAG: hypothetical protein KGL39_28700 [Patescibacteria group bacterium]|nr:hypothetical protein [Patescibacteria group bacterium]